jgi:YgiT-type zinc finger domain-containing protein
MKCPICRKGETRSGTATVTLERAGLTLVVRNVPARVCDNCGEAYVEETEAARVLETATEAERAGVKVDVRDYVAA